MKINTPIFIIGTGRSGSTAFHRMMTKHPNTFWLTGLADRYPDKPSLSRNLFHAMDVPVIGNMMQKRFKPWECYKFWSWYFKGFSRPFRDLMAYDVTEKTKTDIRTVFEQLSGPKRDRGIIKITGWPRIGFLHEIFPEAKFIHIVRDGRAVVNSMINVPFWKGWEGPHNWRWGLLNPDDHAVWEENLRSFIALAALEWKILIDSIRHAGNKLKKTQFIEIRYEDLCENQWVEAEKVIDFCELEATPKFEKEIKSFQFRNENYKWRQTLTENQQSMIEKIMESNLSTYGYLNFLEQNWGIVSK